MFDDPEDEEGMGDNGPESIEEETDGWTADISEDRDPDKPESVFRLNGEVIRLPRKADGNPYYPVFGDQHP